jgi:hypothetical protein
LKLDWEVRCRVPYKAEVIKGTHNVLQV